MAQRIRIEPMPRNVGRERIEVETPKGFEFRAVVDNRGDLYAVFVSTSDAIVSYSLREQNERRAERGE